jgi:hypothetical protein
MMLLFAKIFVIAFGYASNPSLDCRELYSKGNLLVSNVNFWVTDNGPDGMVHTIGLVENDSDLNYYKVRLKVIYLDANGKPLNVEGWLSEYKGELDGSMSKEVEGDIATLETVMIGPKSKSYFHQYRSVSKLKGKVHKVIVEIQREDKMDPEYKMKVSNLSVTPDVETKTIWDGTKVTNDNGMRIKGQLQNIDKISSATPKLAILFYGQDGKIWGDRVVDFTMTGMNSVKLSNYGSIESGAKVSFDILCSHPQIDLNGKIVKIAKVEVIGYKEIPYFTE